jgi:thiol:disulfide interchange protein DsbD
MTLSLGQRTGGNMKRFRAWWLATLPLIALSSWVCHGAPRTQAELVFDADAVRPGDTFWAGVVLRMQPGWHTYWRHSGDAGAPTKIEWEVPAGVRAGAIMWPMPEKYTDAAELTSYVYHGEVMLLVPVTIDEGVAPGRIPLRAKVSWLECEKLCLPGSAQLDGAVEVSGAMKASSAADRVALWRTRLPKTSEVPEASAAWDRNPAEDTRHLVIAARVPSDASGLDFYPDYGDGLEVAGPTEELAAKDGRTRIRKAITRTGEAWPEAISGLLVFRPAGGGAAVGYEWAARLGSAGFGESAPKAGSAGGAPRRGGERPAVVLRDRAFGSMLLLAFLGGVILNIMPCVLPVIALKVLGFVQQSREAPQRVRQLGIIYGVGVLFSFLVLAGIVIGVQQAGRAANWGMQFQNPMFLVAITVLVTLVALNLFGLYEVYLGGGAMTAAYGWASKDGAGGAFFNGVLATTLATPCTAPFLGVALGFAFSQSPLVIVLMFLMVGLGLAFPYVLLACQPAWLRFLPKPGVWMENFKVAMGFPMLATGIWLWSLTVPHFGSGGTLWLGIFLVVLAAAAWVWGRFVQRGRARRGLAMAVSVLLVAGGYFYILERELRWRVPAVAGVVNGAGLVRAREGIPWERWSLAAVWDARGQGRPVLVDFTADWCLTCQANKKTSLEIPSVRAKLKAINAVALLGDYTKQDAAITAELEAFGRAGVPLVVVYPRDPESPPIVLPEVLTPGLVLAALDRAAR